MTAPRKSLDFRELELGLDAEKHLKRRVETTKWQKFKSYKGIAIIGTNRNGFIMAMDGQWYSQRRFKEKFLPKKLKT